LLHGKLRPFDGSRIDVEMHGGLLIVPGAHTASVISENARALDKVKAEHVIIRSLYVESIGCDELLDSQLEFRMLVNVCDGIRGMHHGSRMNCKVRCLKAGQRQPLKMAASNDRSATVEISIEDYLCPTKETP
jgi:hypothetical protein